MNEVDREASVLGRWRKSSASVLSESEQGRKEGRSEVEERSAS